MQNFKRVLLFGTALLGVNLLYAQKLPCPEWPADCPQTEYIKSSESASVRQGNGLLPQEIAMQDKMRDLTESMLQEAVSHLHFTMIKLDETTNLNGLQHGETPDNLRSPRGISLIFQLVVDEDSFHAWRDWRIKFDQDRAAGSDAINRSFTDVTSSPLFKRYQDSSDYYMKKYIAYSDAHKNDPASLNNKVVKEYLEKAGAFADKAAALEQQSMDNNGLKESDEEKLSTTLRYFESSMVQVYFEFNASGCELQAVDDAIISDYSMPGVKIAKKVHLPHITENPSVIPIGSLSRWPHMTALLLGNWEKEAGGNYIAGFNKNGQNDDRTPKKIKSDRVQNVAIYLFGSDANVKKVMSRLNITALNNILYKTPAGKP